MRTLAVLMAAAASTCFADSAPSVAVRNNTAPTVDPQVIIKTFAAKETEFAKARENYIYKQSVKLQELDADGAPSGGKYEIVEDVLFDDKGHRSEHVTYAPPISLEHIGLSPEDEQDLRNILPFVCTSDNIGEYNITYKGREKVDEIGTYVFELHPKTMAKGKRYFDGTIWVDDRDLQIVKTYGQGVGTLKRSDDQAFPKFETYREQIDGKYWFPTYTIAEDTLHFKTGPPQRIKLVVKYQNYKRFKSDVNIQYGDAVDGSKIDQKPETGKTPDQKPQR